MYAQCECTEYRVRQSFGRAGGEEDYKEEESTMRTAVLAPPNQFETNCFLLTHIPGTSSYEVSFVLDIQGLQQ